MHLAVLIDDRLERLEYYDAPIQAFLDLLQCLVDHLNELHPLRALI